VFTTPMMLNFVICLIRIVLPSPAAFAAKDSDGDTLYPDAQAKAQVS